MRPEAFVRRWGVPLALLLSVGVNVGVLASLSRQRHLEAPAAAAADRAVPGAPYQGAVDGSFERPGSRDFTSPRFEIVSRALGLEGAAADRFLALQRDSWDRSRLLRQRLDRARAGLAAELTTGRADPAHVRRWSAEAQEAQAELDTVVVDLLLETQQVLTLEQQQRFARFVLLRMRGGNLHGDAPVGGPLRRMFERRRGEGRGPADTPPGARRGPGPG